MTRKVVLAMQVSLDGFVATADDDLGWLWLHLDNALKTSILTSLHQTSTHVMGRRTYLAQAATWPESSDEIAPLVNRAEKVVVSSTPSSRSTGTTPASPPAWLSALVEGVAAGRPFHLYQPP